MQLNSCTFPDKTYLELDISAVSEANFSLEKILEQSTIEINGQERDGITFSGEGADFPRETQRVVITGGISATTVAGMDVSVGALD